MKKMIGICFLSLFLQTTLFSQNEFGSVGSYWRYNFIPHNGGGSGWTIIKIEKDTVINGEDFKIYKRKSYFQSFMGSVVQDSTTNLIQVKNDSIFQYGNAILDFNMELTDSLYLQNVGGAVDIQLAVDSISTEEINGYQYKKWHGQKICVTGSNPGPYESFTILETVGQIENDYLFWNSDGCLIGGGVHYFVCYQNGDFYYPPTGECEELFLTNTTELIVEEEIEIFPNPTSNILNIKLKHLKIERASILNMDGKEIFHKRGGANQIDFDINTLDQGMYLIKIESDDKIIMSKFIKTNQ